MAKKFTYITAVEACQILRINANNLRQVTFRQATLHEDCANNRCAHMIVEMIAGGKVYYDKDKVQMYLATRRAPNGSRSERKEIRNRRRYDK